MTCPFKDIFAVLTKCGVSETELSPTKIKIIAQAHVQIHINPVGRLEKHSLRNRCSLLCCVRISVHISINAEPLFWYADMNNGRLQVCLNASLLRRPARVDISGVHGLRVQGGSIFFGILQIATHSSLVKVHSIKCKLRSKILSEVGGGVPESRAQV